MTNLVPKDNLTLTLLDSVTHFSFSFSDLSLSLSLSLSHTHTHTHIQISLLPFIPLFLYLIWPSLLSLLPNPFYSLYSPFYCLFLLSSNDSGGVWVWWFGLTVGHGFGWAFAVVMDCRWWVFVCCGVYGVGGFLFVVGFWVFLFVFCGRWWCRGGGFRYRVDL